MQTVKELPSVKLACVVTYGALMRTAAENEILGVLGLHEIPDVGEFGHWNIKKVHAVYKQGDKFLDIRTGKQVELGKNVLVWPIFTGTVLNYPDGKQLLLSRKFNKEQSILLLDVTGEKVPVATTTSLTVRN